MKLVDLTSMQFGLLTVREHAGSNEARQSLWKCECACHEFVVVRATELVSGTRRRCGPGCKFKREHPTIRVGTIDGRAGEQSRFGN